MATTEEHGQFEGWIREVDLFLIDFVGASSRMLRDDPRFEWWTWFRQGCDPEAAADLVMEIIVDDQLAIMRPAATATP